MGRARRSTAKAVDYAKEQEFSDAEDIFAESEDEAPAPKRRFRPRKSVETATHHHHYDMHDAGGDEYESSQPVYTEKGYDPMELPLRERFPFMPEVEADGSPKIDLIVGRRPVDDKNAESSEDEEDGSDDEEASSESDDDGSTKKRRSRKKSSLKKKKKSPKKKKKKGSPTNDLHKNEHVEYEYLVKYKGRSYLHLEWKTGADLESMNKSAKTLYRRYLKKLATNVDDDLEDPNFDPSFAEPQKIVDAKEQEITLELTDKELVEWEKERQKALAEEEAKADNDAMEIEGAEEDESPSKQPEEDKQEEKKEEPTEVIGMYRNESCRCCYSPHTNQHSTLTLLLSFLLHRTWWGWR